MEGWGSPPQRPNTLNKFVKWLWMVPTKSPAQPPKKWMMRTLGPLSFFTSLISSPRYCSPGQTEQHSCVDWIPKIKNTECHLPRGARLSPLCGFDFKHCFLIASNPTIIHMSHMVIVDPLHQLVDAFIGFIQRFPFTRWCFKLTLTTHLIRDCVDIFFCWQNTIGPHQSSGSRLYIYIYCVCGMLAMSTGWSACL